MNILTINGLNKSFGTKKVLNGLDMCVPENSIFGFVGKNGSGKTTTMKAVLGLLRPDSGEILVANERVAFGQTPTNRHIGYLPDVPEFYSFMTPREYLRLCGEVTNMRKSDIDARSEELLALVGLSEERRRIRGFSRGMKQRLGIAQALLADPRLLICDEPTSALDPIGRKEILDILLAVRDQTTVLFSTHILSDVERICTDVAFLHNGTVQMQGSVADIKTKYRSDEYRLELEDPAAAALVLAAYPEIRISDGNLLLFREGEKSVFDVMQFVASKRIALLRIERAEPTLESLFMEVTGK